VAFAGLVFTPGNYLYADLDGLLVASRSLTE
jgi:regulator of RNase E activity RraA